jgi:hypothetical protein
MAKQDDKLKEPLTVNIDDVKSEEYDIEGQCFSPLPEKQEVCKLSPIIAFIKDTFDISEGNTYIQKANKMVVQMTSDIKGYIDKWNVSKQ